MVDVDDKLLSHTSRSIPRDDVAELCVQCLKLEGAKNRAFDVISKAPAADAPPTTDFAALLDGLQGANCDYTINDQWAAAASDSVPTAAAASSRS